MYSLNDDGRDDGGVKTLQGSSDRHALLDLVFYLDGRPMRKDAANATPSSTETGEDDEDIDDGGRKGDENESAKGEQY